MLFVRHVGPFLRGYCLQSGLMHDATNLLPRFIPSILLEFQGDLTISIEGDDSQDFEDSLKNNHFIGGISLSRLVVVCRTMDFEYPALFADAHTFLVIQFYSFGSCQYNCLYFF